MLLLVYDAVWDTELLTPDICRLLGRYTAQTYIANASVRILQTKGHRFLSVMKKNENISEPYDLEIGVKQEK